jgi:galactose-1-phosphate uridylyltransferase
MDLGTPAWQMRLLKRGVTTLEFQHTEMSLHRDNRYDMQSARGRESAGTICLTKKHNNNLNREALNDDQNYDEDR